jgi:hypothetical protein
MFTSWFAGLTSLFLAGGAGIRPVHEQTSTVVREDEPGVPSPPPEQESRWTWRVAPYLFAANIDGMLTVGNVEVDTDVSFSDLLNSLDFGAMLLFEGHHGRYGFLLDSAYMDLSEDGKGSEGVEREAELRMGIVSLAGLWRVAPTSPCELALGLRYLDLEQELTVGTASADGDSQILDGIVGARAAWPFAERWRFGLYADVGAGGSDLTWQTVANLGYDFTDWGLNLGYRILSYDVEDASKEADIAFEGWQLGFEYRF